MTDLATLLQSFVDDETVEAVWNRLETYMDGHGFNHMLYAATHFRTIYSPGDARDALILTNYPKEYTDQYLGGGLFQQAPVVRWAMTNTGAVSWRAFTEDAMAGKLSEAEMNVVMHNQRHGITAGYAISFPRSSPRAGFGIGLASTQMDQDAIDALWKRDGAEIHLVAGVAHLKLISLPHGDYVRALTPRQREALELVADGKTVQDAALLMELNPATVEKHLRLAREALEVETTAQAIRKVSTHNQFFLFPRE